MRAHKRPAFVATVGATGVPAILDRVAASHQQVRVLLRDAEGLQRERFATDLADELALVDDASSLLAKVVGMAVGRGGEVEIDVDDDTGVPSDADAATVQLIALRYLGIRGVRIVRAAQSVLATGYEPEARVYERILLEIIEHIHPEGPVGQDSARLAQRKPASRREREGSDDGDGRPLLAALARLARRP